VIPQQNTPGGVLESLSNSYVVVQVDWIQNEAGTFDKVDKSFYKLDAGKARPKSNMDINLMELGV
jgi:hypothetical protein